MRRHVPTPGALALLVSNEVGAYGPHPIVVHAPSERWQVRHLTCSLGVQVPHLVRMSAPRLVVALDPLRFPPRGRERGLRGRSLGRRLPLLQRRALGEGGLCSEEGCKHCAHGPPCTVGPAPSAPSVPTRTMTHRSSSWLLQVGITPRAVRYHRSRRLLFCAFPRFVYWYCRAARVSLASKVVRPLKLRFLTPPGPVQSVGLSGACVRRLQRRPTFSVEPKYNKNSFSDMWDIVQIQRSRVRFR